MTTRKHTRFVHEGNYYAAVNIELIDTENGWSPYLSLDDALKLDEVRQALRKKDFTAAGKRGKVFELSRVKVA